MPEILATWETEVGGSQFVASPGKVNVRLYLKNKIKQKKKQKDWGHYSNGRVVAYQAQGPELKPHYRKGKKKPNNPNNNNNNKRRAKQYKGYPFISSCLLSFSAKHLSFSYLTLCIGHTIANSFSNHKMFWK
jgi:hypothetical protein